MSNTVTRRDSNGRKLRLHPHRLSMRAAAMRREFKARQAEIAAQIAARAAEQESEIPA